mgnify:CR=1 FL=1
MPFGAAGAGEVEVEARGGGGREEVLASWRKRGRRGRERRGRWCRREERERRDIGEGRRRRDDEDEDGVDGEGWCSTTTSAKDSARSRPPGCCRSCTRTQDRISRSSTHHNSAPIQSKPILHPPQHPLLPRLLNLHHPIPVRLLPTRVPKREMLSTRRLGAPFDAGLVVDRVGKAFRGGRGVFVVHDCVGGG